MTTDDEQRQQLLDLLDHGYTVEQLFESYIERRREEYACPLHTRFREINLGEAWINGHEGFWLRAIELGQQGATFPEAISTMGFQNQADIDRIDQLEHDLTEKNQIIEAGTRENNDLKRQLKDITLMDQDTYNEVMSQARAELIRRGWQPPRR
jgi:hypothetical protein